MYCSHLQRRKPPNVISQVIKQVTPAPQQRRKNTVLMHRNFDFVGRMDLLDKMYKFFHATSDCDKAGLRCCPINGLAGQGKSQLALEYAHKYRDEYNATFWVNADTKDQLVDSYSLIAKEIALEKDKAGHTEEFIESSPELLVDGVRTWLETTSRSPIFVFD